MGLKLKINRIEIKNYGNLSSISLDNLSDLNILIGPNNSGKTHILRAIEMLNKAVDAHGIGREEKYLQDYSRRIEMVFDFGKYSLTLRENENRVLECSEDLPSELREFIERKPVLFCPDERLRRYKEKNLEDYVTDALPKDKEENLKEHLMRIDPKIIEFEKTRLAGCMLGRRYKDRLLECKINEQGSGVRSLICLITDILAQDKDIILIDEPELGLHPLAKQSFLKWLLELSKDKQIFVATHDPAFVNPLVVGKENVTVYLYTPIDERFIKIDFSKGEENPSLFAGFMPHTSSLKEIHIYVEGTADAYVFQAMLHKFLQRERQEDWFEIFNKVGIYHLGGDNFKHLLYTIPLTPKSVVILDGNKRGMIKKVIEKLNDYGAGKVFPEFVLCDSVDRLGELFGQYGKCPVYCLEKDDVKDYFGLKTKKPKEIAKHAWSADDVPDEFCKIFEATIIQKVEIDKSQILSKSLKPVLVFSNRLNNPKISKRLRISGDWSITSEGLVQWQRKLFSKVLIEGLKLKNGIVEVEAKTLDDGGSLYIILRSDDVGDNCYMFGIAGVGKPYNCVHVLLWKEGVAKELLKITNKELLKDFNLQIQPNEFYKYRVVFKDDMFEFFIDDKKIGVLKDSTYDNKGYIGLLCGSRAVFRNLKVWSLD
jgi:ABC-type phosphate transport system ATPase subunit